MADTPLVPGSERELVAEADDLLTEIIKRKDRLNQESVGMAFYNRSSARKMLGRWDDALDDLDEAVRMLPNEVAVQLTYGVTLDQTENTESAERVLRKACAREDVPPGGKIILAMLLARTNRESEALELLESVRVPMGLVDESERFEYCRVLCDRRRNAGVKRYSADMLPCDDLIDFLPSVLASILRARWLQEFGRLDRVNALLDAIALEDVERFHETVALSLASVLGRAGRHEAVMEVLRPRLRPGALTDSARMYVQAAYAAGRHEEVRERCRTIREAGVLDRGLIAFETGVLSQYDASGEAAAILRKWLEQQPDDLESWLSLGNAAVDADDHATVKEVAGRLPDPANAPADLLYQLLRFVFRDESQTPEARAEYVYAVWRKHRMIPIAAKSLAMAVLIPPDGRTPNLPPPATVQVGCGVVVEREGKSDRDSYFILNAQEVDKSWGELTPDEPLAKAMIGQAPLASIEVPGALLPQHYKILAFADAKVHAAHVVMDRWTDHFPNDPFVQAVRAIDPESPAQAPRLSKEMQAFQEAGKQRKAQIANVWIAYHNQYVSTRALADALSEPHVPVIETILMAPPMHLKAVFDPQTDMPLAIRHCAARPKIVIGLTAAVVLAKLNLLDEVAKIVQFIVPRRVMDELTLAGSLPSVSYSLAPEWFGEAGPLGRPGDFTHSALMERRKAWSAAAHTLRQTSEIPDSLAVAKIEPGAREHLLRALGPVDASAVAIALHRGLWWMTDDAWTARYAKEEFGVQRASSISLLLGLRGAKVLDRERCDDALAELIGWNVVGVPINPDVFVAAMRRAEWDVDQSPAVQTLAAFESRDPSPEVVLGQMANTLTRMWREVPPGVSAESIAFHLLDALDARPDGRQIGEALIRVVADRFKLDVLAADRATKVIRAWLKTPSGGMNAGGLLLPRPKVP